MTIRLYHLSGNHQGTTSEFNLQRIRIGRAQENDLQFDPIADRIVSGKHGEIRFENNSYLLYDLGSSNGTYLNGRLIQCLELHLGDVIQFGQKGPALRVDGMDQTVVQWPQTIKDTPSSELMTPQVSPFSQNIEATEHCYPIPITQITNTSGRTSYYKAIVVNMVKSASLKFKVLIILITLLFLSIIGVGGYFLFRHFEAQKEELKAELQKKMETPKKTPAPKKPLVEKANPLTSPRPSLAILANRLHKTIFLLIYQYKKKIKGFCTAFAIDSRGILATNAHCITTIKRLQSKDKYFKAFARMNMTTGKKDARQLDSGIFRVIDYVSHPRHKGIYSPDIGLIQLDLRGRRLRVIVEIMPSKNLYDFKMGEKVFTIGFPGMVMKTYSPVATLKDGTVSRLTDYSGNVASTEKAKLLWHNFSISKGTSGSPIFNEDGKLIAINNAALGSKPISQFDKSTGQYRREIVITGEGLNFGIRADELFDLILQVKKSHPKWW